MPRVVLRGATVVDADGARPRTTVVVEDRRIATVSTGEALESGPGDRVVELGGRTVMPGMVSSHFHATYNELGSKTAPFGLEEPPALQAVRAAHHLELLLRSGFTGAVSAGAPFAIDASMKAAIAEGLFPGPRLMAGSRDVSTTGHAGDKSFPWYWDVGARGAINRSDGPDGFRLAVREEIKQGAEIIKMFVTGGHGTVAPSEQTEMTPAEITAGIEAAHQRGVLVRGHIANREAIHMALDAGIDVIDHGDGMDAMAIERMVELGTFLVPSQLFPVRFAQLMGGGGLGFTAAMAQDIEQALAILPKANEAGVKMLCGDDYGAISLPHGRYADELEFYVKEAGIPPLDVIRWATRNGAELMGRSHELGSVREGYLADLLVVDGDPLADIAILQDPAKLLAVMKGGTLVRDELTSSRQAERRYPPAMIIIAGSLSFDPEDRDDVLASLAEVTEASRRDAGCVEYFWGEDLEAANTFRFFECWESQELFDAHIAQPHEVAFGERNLTRITGATATFFEASPTAPIGIPSAG